MAVNMISDLNVLATKGSCDLRREHGRMGGALIFEYFLLLL